MKQLPNSSSNLPTLLRKIVAFIVTATVLGLVLMFSAVLLLVIVIVGALAFAYLWWKTRHVRKQMRDFAARSMEQKGAVFEGDVIEGEVIRVDMPADGRSKTAANDDRVKDL
ncbi:MAG: hypothetical protein PHQ60_16010 [Sideroxydans sp.]|nr:hypothetical protein [Sideroxydans sp.]